MTAQHRYGPGVGYAGQTRTAWQRADQRSQQTQAKQKEADVRYIYGDRICGKTAKQRQLYRTFGQAAGFTPGASGRNPSGAAPHRKTRRKLVLENIINLFESIDQRGREAVEAAKRNAVMRKKLLEHRRGIGLALMMLAIFTAFVILVYNLVFGISTIYAENTLQYTEAEIVAASGVTLGDKLYSFRADEVENRITFYCPYVRSVDVTRTIPNRIGFDVESDIGVYVVEIYGEEMVLSENLRVLGPYGSAEGQELIRLCLPEIRYSVEGRVIDFADAKDERLIRDTLFRLRASGLSDRVDLVDLRNGHSIVMHCDDLYLLQFGGETEMEYKLRFAEKTIDSSAFRQGTPAEIDLSVVGEASVRYDHTLQLTAD